MALIKSFRELDVYRMAVREAKRIFLLTQSFPKEERYSLTDQVRRSSRAVGAMIAEGWGRRRYPASFIHKITEGIGEALETQSWLDHAFTSGYITREQYHIHDDPWKQIGGKLQRMIQKHETFCGSSATVQ